MAAPLRRCLGEPITGDDERIGARNFVAPELREFAEHKQADKADVYSLAKCFWVLASGKPMPPDHQLRRETPALRVSTHCHHKYVESLDALMERSTEYDSALRPSMREFAAELSEWLKLKEPSSPSGHDLSALVKECRGVIETKMTAERNKEQLVKQAGAVSAAFDSTFALMHKQILEVTGLNPEGTFVNYQNNTGFPEMSQGAVVISKYGREIRVIMKMGPIEVSHRGCVLFEVRHDIRIRILAGLSDL